MACTICGEAAHEVAACPKAPAPDSADKLLSLLDRAANRAAEATREAIETSRVAALSPPASAPEPPAPGPDPGKELRKRAEELINAGRAGEALELIQQTTFGPQSAALATLARSVGQTNVNELRRVYGQKFTKREAAFNSTVRQYNAETALADPKVVEQLWNITIANDPTYVKEEVDERLKAADEERRAQIASMPPPLSPIEESLALPDTMKALAKKHLDEDDKERVWQLQQIAAYGLTLEQYLRQADKAGDPESTYGIGVGKWRRDIWTQIGGKSRPVPTRAA